ncbi:hypothetical protein CPB83DRAFT_837351 [Crepidotus variabilis]|uniref:DUF6534 domain-containing protein n=1 Tax=Crepidotus variabilis TaxID=179855 RepID=A0A9P6JMS4_9AGAR|nr:hypothetical protein CPB83DRAFT_837351 [Crepidotus variabilis]
MGDFDKTVGVLLLGLFFNTFLYGLVLYQFIVYKNTTLFQDLTFPEFNDPLWIKALVGTLFFVDTLHSAVAVYSGWETCVTNYANPASLAIVSWTIPFTAVATSVAAILSQGFLAHRVHKLTQDMRLVAVIVSFSVVAFVFGVYSGIRSGILHEVKNFAPLKPFVISWLGFQTAADLSITLVLTYMLARSKTGFRKTDSIINRMIRGAVQTGLFASIFALGDLFSFVLHQDTLLYAMFAYPIGRIYTNTLLDTLNSRKKLMEKADEIDDDDDSDLQVESKGYKMKSASQTFAAPETTVDAKQSVA